MKLLKKYFEMLLILFALLSAVLAWGEMSFAALLMLTSFMTLAFYYMLSAVLVLADKRVSRPVRLLFVVGLYVLSAGIAGSLFRMLFWTGGEALLISALSFGAAVLIIAAVYYTKLKAELKDVIGSQLASLIKRVVPYLLLFALTYLAPTATLFDLVGQNRNDIRYRALFLKSMDNPDDADLRDSLNSYRTKMLNHDNHPSPGNR